MSVLRPPDSPALPLFDYGLLKPGELAFSLWNRSWPVGSQRRSVGRCGYWTGFRSLTRTVTVR